MDFNVIWSMLGGASVFGGLVSWGIKRAFAMHSEKISGMAKAITEMEKHLAVDKEQKKQIDTTIIEMKQTFTSFCNEHKVLSMQAIEGAKDMVRIELKIEAAFRIIDTLTGVGKD